MNAPTPHWRPMRADDLPEVATLARALHPGLPERNEVFAERWRLFPLGCLVVADADRLRGYTFSHPIATDQPPALDTLLGALPPDAQDYYLHDLALCPTLRGSGLARQGVERLLAIADAYPRTVLISVHDTSGFWSRFGFRPSPTSLGGKLLAYGADAVYMERVKSPAAPSR